ncbi:hypothetical protein EPO05_00045 [Patescibacteria group bacterium]|nr:MAG: hypothetical protein EPO05_00045 [Patescibacteria group bacterium]
MNKLEEKLGLLGLNHKEIGIYLAILSGGKNTISGIALRSKIKRTSIYQHLQVLLDKGLIYKAVDRKRVLYIAEDPEKIVNVVESQKRRLDRQKVELEKIIPELQSMFSVAFSKPKVNFYEGREGIKNIYKEFVETHQNIYSFFSPYHFFKLFSHAENDELLMRLYANGGQLHNLVERSDEAVARLKVEKYKSFTKSKFLPADFKFENDLLVTGDKVALISFKNLIGVIICDQAIADLQRNIFKLIWGKV